jgi:hypothetical protein
MERLRPTDLKGHAAAFGRDGYFVQERVLSSETVESLRQAIAALPERAEVRRKQSVYGVRNLSEVVCTVGLGGVVAMCPLTLHASAASQAVGHRRVIHIEYAAAELPDGLQWHQGRK